MPREKLNLVANMAGVIALTLCIGLIGAWAATRNVRPVTHLAKGVVAATPSPSPIPSPTKPAPPPSLPSTAQVVAPSTNVVWALIDYQALFVSTDQGNSWVKRSLPTAAGGIRPVISFINDHEGWLLAPGSPATQCEEATAGLWHTSDGAVTWQQLNVSSIDKSQCKNGIWFIDSKHGFVSAQDPNHRPTVYRTSDDGNSWAGTALSDPPSFHTSGAGISLHVDWVKAFGSTLYLEASDGFAQPDLSHQFVFTSGDWGATWQFLSKLPSRDVVMVTQSRWLVLTNDHLETLNGGQQWHPYTTDLIPDSLEFGGTTVVFADSQVGYETGGGALQGTSNGGAQWVRIPTPGTQPVTIPSPPPSGIPTPTDAVLSAPTKVVWALVASQVLFRSTDQGASWQARTLPVVDRSYSPLVSFVDGTTGFVMYRSPSGDCTGQIALLWSTFDGGTTWQIANGMPTSACKDALYFTDAQHGLLSTGDSFNVATIWRTQDGGHTWVKAMGDAKRPAPRVNSFQAYGSTVVAYAPPFVYRSTDGGQTWSYVTQSPHASKTIGFVTSARWIELISPDLSSETTDGGQSWHSFVTNYSQAAPIPPQIVFADANVGYATVRGEIQRTLDGGAHWEMIKTSWP